MKTRFIVVTGCFALVSGTWAQDSQQITNQPTDTPYSVTARDANSRVWERTTYTKDVLTTSS